MPSGATAHCATSSGSTSRRAASGSPSAACSRCRSPSTTPTATSSSTRSKNSPKPAPRCSTVSRQDKPRLVGGAPLDRHLDVIDLARRLGNGQSILPQPGQVQFYGLTDKLLRLFHCRARRNASWKIRHICGIVIYGSFDDNGIAHRYLIV